MSDIREQIAMLRDSVGGGAVEDIDIGHNEGWNAALDAVLEAVSSASRSLADDPQALRLWFGEHIWAADDFGGVDDGTLTQLFDLIEPEWRKFTWEGKRAAEGEQ